jgi:hypothetical protein
MSLHLISMFVDTSKEVSSAVDVQHDTLPFIAALFALIGIRLHLNPLAGQWDGGLPPLPPLTSANLLNTVFTELVLQKSSGFVNMVVGNGDCVDLDPLRMGYPLGRECL